MLNSCPGLSIPKIFFPLLTTVRWKMSAQIHNIFFKLLLFNKEGIKSWRIGQEIFIRVWFTLSKGRSQESGTLFMNYKFSSWLKALSTVLRNHLRNYSLLEVAVEKLTFLQLFLFLFFLGQDQCRINLNETYYEYKRMKIYTHLRSKKCIQD